MRTISADFRQRFRCVTSLNLCVGVPPPVLHPSPVRPDRNTIVYIASRRAHMPETVLVIDDHSLVLTTLVSTLNQAGFKVLAAASGEEALEIASNTRHPIDLLICDVILPGLPGTEIARRI